MCGGKRTPTEKNAFITHVRMRESQKIFRDVVAYAGIV